MSAYIVERRTIDYLISSVGLGTRAPSRLVFYPAKGCPELAILQASHPVAFTTLNDAQYGTVTQFPPERVTANVLGGIAENYRSVNHRYMEANAPQYRYSFRRVATALQPEWVIRSVERLDYQSCQCPDHRLNIAYEFKARRPGVLSLRALKCDRLRSVRLLPKKRVRPGNLITSL
jgi:hypothetical protein